MPRNIISTSYKITIERIETVEQEYYEHKLLEKRPLTDEEREKNHRYLQEVGYKDVYGYTEKTTLKLEQNKTTVYEQTLPADDIKVPELVAHINKSGRGY